MKAIQKLIDQTFSYSMEAIDDLKELYISDMKQFQEVQFNLTFGDYEAAAKVVEDMDTEPREQIVMALIEDFGASLVENKFGFSLA